MINKYLEKEMKVFFGEDGSENRNPIELEYYITESETAGHSELSGQKVYGVEIIKKSDSGRIESELIKNVSCCYERTKNILSKLAENTVTPVGLPFVLDDIIGA